MHHLLIHQHVLLLQGKMGTSFHRLATYLKTQNITVSKINFNAGDAFFYHHADAHDYTGTVEDFAEWIGDFIKKYNIDAVICFGDCRPHHLQAGRFCDDNGVSFFVFEEGYLRPDYITFEEHGINGFSRLDAKKVHSLPKAKDAPIYTQNRFYRLCIAAIVYYTVTRAFSYKYPHYKHYRGMTAWQEAGAWLKAPYRKLRHYWFDKNLQTKLVEKHDKNYFVVSLQVHNDSQITHHSDYNDVTEFIEEVIASFATNASSQVQLVFKHHPLDRGHRDYRELIKALAKKHEVANRVFYGCDMHLPTLMKHSIGMVTVNSTTGLQSIYHKKPTKLMGRAIYNIDKLTDQQPLDSFWQNPQQPDNDFYLRFREYLIEENQLNGSFYGRSPWQQYY